MSDSLSAIEGLISKLATELVIACLHAKATPQRLVLFSMENTIMGMDRHLNHRLIRF